MSTSDPPVLDIDIYLSRPDIQDILGVEPGFNHTWVSRPVNTAFAEAGDGLHSTYPYVAALLERGIDVLIYVGKCARCSAVSLIRCNHRTSGNTYAAISGTYDWTCNWIGNYNWVRAFEWSGHDAFAAEELRGWKVDGVVAGETKSAHGLTWATVFEAGHMVSSAAEDLYCNSSLKSV